MLRLPITTAVLLVLLPHAAGRAADEVPSPLAARLDLRVERDEQTGVEIRRGTFAVYEDRAAGRGRMLHLPVVVLPATGPDPAPDPIFAIAGGPGQAIAPMQRLLQDSWLREQRDIVLVSQRGTDGDNHLFCELPGSDDDPQGYLAPLFQTDVFRDCLERLGAWADLRQYSTPIAMDDLDEVREALGYETINLMGGSYGSRAALVFMRRHPERVRTAVLNGVAPIAFRNPLYHAAEAQAALDRILAECAGDPACREAYPDLAERLLRLLAQLEEEPARVELVDDTSGDVQVVHVDREAFAEALRVLMYYDSREIPYLLDLATRNELDVFARTAIGSARAIRDGLALGMLLCVTCAEDVDRIAPADIAAETAGTFLGDARVHAQKEVCALWPRSELPADYGEPVSVDVPVLVLSGTCDPVTGPRWGEEAARHLPNAVHVVAPGSHGVGGECIDAIVGQLLATGSTRGLDLTCVEDLEPPPFRMR